MGDYGHALQFGVFITPAAGDADQVVALAELADTSGLDLVTFQDHPYQPRFLDTWTLLSFVAARTNRVRLSPNVLNLPLRLPSVVARAVASLDILSGGRAELALGAGAFWDAIEAMGGRRLRPGESVDALEEAIDVIRELWDVEQPAKAKYEGSYYPLTGSARGPAPVHDVSIWIGAYKPRMLALTGRKGDGWLPSLSYLGDDGLAAGNRAIDEAAAEAGRDPAAIRRLLNIPAPEATTDEWVEQFTRLALEDGVGTFILTSDDPATVETFAREIAPAVRERVAAARGGEPPAPKAEEDTRLDITPTPDDGARLSDTAPWDETTRPHRPPSPPDTTYSRRGKLVGRHLIDVHDMLRSELADLRDVLVKVRDGAMSAGDGRSALHDMTLRQNDWTLGAFCSRYCAVVTQHHGLEDDAVFPHLARSDASLGPVIDRLTDEHLAIHDAIQKVDLAFVGHINDPQDFEPLQEAIDYLTDALLSHLSYEEQELVEPLARLGFFPGQL